MKIIGLSGVAVFCSAVVRLLVRVRASCAATGNAPSYAAAVVGSQLCL